MNILPDPFKRGDINFIFAKRLPYLTRLKLVLALIFGGILIQLVLNFWAGFALLVIGTGLSLIKGYADRPELRYGSEEWNQVTPDEFEKVRSRQARLKKWDIDCFDITNPRGKLIFFAVTLFCVAIWFVLHAGGEERLARYWGFDALVLLAPHWFSGVRSFLKKDRLIIKIGLLEKIMSGLSGPSDIQVLPMLSTKEAIGGGRIPMDARVMIRLLNAPAYFLGMQIQVSINNVQGKYYPYLYCVLLAKKEEELFKKRRDLLDAPPRKIVFEKTGSDGVDVLVIRQHTTKRSGYYTNPKKSAYIVNTGLDLSRRLLMQSGGRPS